MPSIFTKIINREIPAHIIAEDDHYLAFLDINPLVIGHVLVIAKQPVDFIFDIDDNTLSGLVLFAKRVATGMKVVFPDRRIGMAVIGLEVPHAHIHLVPMKSSDDLNFTRPKLTPTKEALAEAAAKIKARL